MAYNTLGLDFEIVIPIRPLSIAPGKPLVSSTQVSPPSVVFQMPDEWPNESR